LSISAKDLATTAPVIKKPKTLNPLGAVIYGLAIGGGHTLIYASLLRDVYKPYISVFGFLLVGLSMFIVLVTLSLTTKSILFTLKIDKARTLAAQYVFQVLLFYLGFTPIYGFSIVYFEKTIEFWEIFLNTAIVVVLFAVALYLSIWLMKKENPSLGHLKQLMYQPKKLIIIGICITISAVATAVLFAF
jgi:hypothetical protein